MKKDEKNWLLIPSFEKKLITANVIKTDQIANLVFNLIQSLEKSTIAWEAMP